MIAAKSLRLSALVWVSILAAWLPAATVHAQLLQPDNVAVVNQGRKVYLQQCAACHGTKLEGQPNWRKRNAAGRLPAPPHDETGHTWHHPDEMLFELTKTGSPYPPDYETDMPRYEGLLSDQDIIAVLSFIKSSWPAEIREIHDEINERE